MKVISYIQLYNRLQCEGYSVLQTLRSINCARKMDKSVQMSLLDWINDKDVHIVIEGISYSELVQKENMSPFRAFQMLDWLCKEPYKALMYMALDRHIGVPIKLPSKDVDRLDDIIRELGGDPNGDNIDKDTSDIIIN